MLLRGSKGFPGIAVRAGIIALQVQDSGQLNVDIHKKTCLAVLLGQRIGLQSQAIGLIEMAQLGLNLGIEHIDRRYIVVVMAVVELQSPPDILLGLSVVALLLIV